MRCTKTPDEAPAFPSLVLRRPCGTLLFLARAGTCVSRGRVSLPVNWGYLKDGVKTWAIFIRHHFNCLSQVRVSELE